MIAVVLLGLIASASSPYRPLPGDPLVQRQAIVGKDVRVAPPSKTPQSCATEREVAGLPFARGRSFCSLDAYLAHLESQGAIDLPWWRQVRPGLYEYVRRMPGAARETATRAQLLERFGFDR